MFYDLDWNTNSYSSEFKISKRWRLFATPDYLVLTRYSELEPYTLQWLQTLDFNSEPFTAKTLPWHGTIDATLGLKLLMSPWAWNSFC